MAAAQTKWHEEEKRAEIQEKNKKIKENEKRTVGYRINASRDENTSSFLLDGRSIVCSSSLYRQVDNSAGQLVFPHTNGAISP